MNWLAVFIGGGLGSILRYGVSRMTMNYSKSFPLGTLISNVVATLILALIIFYFSKSIKTDSFLYFFLAIGLCGGFSTFSTFSLETFNLFENGMIGYAILNIILNLIICTALVFLVWLAAKS